MTEARTCPCGNPITHYSETGLCRPCVGIKSNPAAVMPADFRDHAPNETNAQLSARYGYCAKLIKRWRRECGTAGVRTAGVRACPVPDGFALVAPMMTVKELRVRFRCSAAKVARFCKETGVLPRVVQRSTASGRPAPRPRRVSRIVVGNAEKRFTPRDAANRDMSRAGMAADFLRRLGPVFRCTETGRADPHGSHWNRGGRTIFDDAGIICRAVELGWRPDAWMEVRAA